MKHIIKLLKITLRESIDPQTADNIVSVAIELLEEMSEDKKEN